MKYWKPNAANKAINANTPTTIPMTAEVESEEVEEEEEST